MRVLVTGARGMLGQDVARVLNDSGFMVFPFGHKQLDITDMEAIYRTFKKCKPDVIVNCAAYTEVDKAEEEKDLAFQVNALGVQNLAIACEGFGILICHISTDYVFDGEKKGPYTPFDNPNPINTYGLSKLAGEKYIQWITNKFYIVRTSWLYGKNGKNFVNTILKLAKEKKEIKIVSDQISSPTWTISLAEFLSKLILTSRYGIYHFTNRTDGGISWYEFAKEILKLARLNMKVIPISTEEYPTPAKRPKNSALDISISEIIVGANPISWHEALSKYFKIRGTRL